MRSRPMQVILWLRPAARRRNLLECEPLRSGLACSRV